MHLKTLSRDLHLLFESPIEFLYSFTYSDTKKVNIEPFDPEVKKTGNELVEKIREELPSLIVHFVGSPVLEVPGQRDIDLYIECDPNNFTSALPKMVKLFGAPKKSRERFHEWHFREKNCDVEILLGDPNLPNFKDPIRVCTILAQSPETTKAYAELKQKCNGISEREYKRERLVFFNKLLK